MDGMGEGMARSSRTTFDDGISRLPGQNGDCYFDERTIALLFHTL